MLIEKLPGYSKMCALDGKYPDLAPALEQVFPLLGSISRRIVESMYDCQEADCHKTSFKARYEENMANFSTLTRLLLNEPFSASIRNNIGDIKLNSDFDFVMSNMVLTSLKLRSKHNIKNPNGEMVCCGDIAAIGSTILNVCRPDIDHKVVFGYTRHPLSDPKFIRYDHFWVEAYSDQGGGIYIFDNSSLKGREIDLYSRTPVIETSTINRDTQWKRYESNPGAAIIPQMDYNFM